MPVVITNTRQFFIIPSLHRFILYRAVFDEIVIVCQQMFAHHFCDNPLLAFYHLILDTSDAFVLKSFITFDLR